MAVTEEPARSAARAVARNVVAAAALPLLIVNCAFLGFTSYVLGEVSQNAAARNTSQMDLIGKLANDIRDCRQGPNKSNWLDLPKVPLTIPIRGQQQ